MLLAWVIGRVLLNEGQLARIKLRCDAILLKYILAVVFAAPFEILDHALQLLYLQLQVRCLSYLVQVTASCDIAAIQASPLLLVDHG